MVPGRTQSGRQGRCSGQGSASTPLCSLSGHADRRPQSDRTAWIFSKGAAGRKRGSGRAAVAVSPGENALGEISVADVAGRSADGVRRAAAVADAARWTGVPGKPPAPIPAASPGRGVKVGGEPACPSLGVRGDTRALAATLRCGFTADVAAEGSSVARTGVRLTGTRADRAGRRDAGRLEETPADQPGGRGGGPLPGRPVDGTCPGSPVERPEGRTAGSGAGELTWTPDESAGPGLPVERPEGRTAGSGAGELTWTPDESAGPGLPGERPEGRTAGSGAGELT
jgi:hypothetical protein